MEKPTALIIEDDQMLATFFATTFEDAGYMVMAVHDGERAMSYLSESVPTIILCDLQLPDVSGELILSYIRNQTKFADTRVLAASVEGTRVNYLQNQVDLVLTKPVSYKQLLTLAERLHPSFESKM
ncbi:MAG: response regulator [Anaerolineae bacterium]|nr:response regulator [Anaerolineae bacterium]